MTFPLQRIYNSPNCRLILEGFAEENKDGIQILSVLTNAKCQIIGINQSLTGGKDFLISLVKSVSLYAQEFLSGITHPHEKTNIYLQKIEEKNRHLLTWQKDDDNQESKIELEITTAQLFDLVETIDQFLIDSSTLPELSLDLKPVSRRYRQVEENLIQQSTPALLGLGSFALMAIALFMIPIPSEIKDPRLNDDIIKQEMKEKEPQNQLPSSPIQPVNPNPTTP